MGLEGVARGYRGLQRCTGVYRRLQGSRNGCRGYKGIQGVSRVKGLSRGYEGLQGVTGVTRVTGAYNGLNGVTSG